MCSSPPDTCATGAVEVMVANSSTQLSTTRIMENPIETLFSRNCEGVDAVPARSLLLEEEVVNESVV